MMMSTFVVIFLTILPLSFGQVCTDTKSGKSVNNVYDNITENIFVYQCLEDNLFHPIGCQPDDKTFVPLKDTHAIITSPYVIYLCYLDDTEVIHYDPVACVTPDGIRVEVNETKNITGFGQASCSKNAAGAITTKLTRGCVTDEQYVAPNGFAVVAKGTVKIKCLEQSKTNYTWKAYQCVLPTGQEIEVNDYWYNVTSRDFFTCTAQLEYSENWVNQVSNISCGNFTDTVTNENTERFYEDTWRNGTTEMTCVYITGDKTFVAQASACIVPTNTKIPVTGYTTNETGYWAYCNSDGYYHFIGKKYWTCTQDGVTFDLKTTKTIGDYQYTCLYNGGSSWARLDGIWFRGTSFTYHEKPFAADIYVPRGGKKRTSEGTASGVKQINGVWQLYQLNAEDYANFVGWEEGEFSAMGYSGSGSFGGCYDSLSLCKNMTSLCNPKPKHEHAWDEWCSDDNIIYDDEYCPGCINLLKTNVDMIRAFCPKTCNTCSQNNNKLLLTAADALANAYTAFK